MSLSNAALKKAMLNNDGAAHALTGVDAGVGSGSGLIHLFAGTPPADADTALDMVATHTYLGTLTSDAGVGTNKLSFGAATSSGSPPTAVLPKTSTETWSTGNMTFSGFQAASPTLTCTFARMGTEAKASMEGAGSTTPRVQLLVAQAGEPQQDINLSSSVLTAGASFTLDNFQLQI